MRLLIVANGFPPTAYGGVEVYTQQIARGLQDRGHDVLVLCRESDPSRPDASLLQDEVGGIQVVRLVNDYKRPDNFRFSYADARIDALFDRELASFRPDCVHYNHWIALSTGLPAHTQRRGIPAVLSLHDYWPICHRVNLITSRDELCPGGSPDRCYQCVYQQGYAGRRHRLAQLLRLFLPLDWRIRAFRWLGLQNDFGLLTRAGPRDFAMRQAAFTLAFRQVDQILTPSNFVRDTYRANGFDLPHAQVLPLGVEIRPMERHPAMDLLRIGFVGTVVKIKGIDRLVSAFRATPAEHIRLEIYGREDLDPFYNRHVHSLADGDPRITFHGPFSPEQRAEIYANLDVLVIPSVVHESFSLVAREALIAGAPVVAARVGALPELIHEGVNGYLYPPEAVDALSAILARLAARPGMLSDLQLPGPVEIFDPDTHIERLEIVYRSAFGRRDVVK